jgi:hypothetical protein
MTFTPPSRHQRGKLTKMPANDAPIKTTGNESGNISITINMPYQRALIDGANTISKSKMISRRQGGGYAGPPRRVKEASDAPDMRQAALLRKIAL